jgi:type VI secretion system protein ImpF
MPRAYFETVKPSVLDRLIDVEPDNPTESKRAKTQDEFEYRDAVMKDLESLLNTRQVRSNLEDSDQELATSLLTYGLPDFTSIGVDATEDHIQVFHAIKRAIERFEPRLRDVQIETAEESSKSDSVLRLTIKAYLCTHPEPIPVTFDTVLQTTTGECHLEAK